LTREGQSSKISLTPKRLVARSSKQFVLKLKAKYYPQKMIKKLTNIFDRSVKILRSTDKDLKVIREIEENVRKMTEEEIKSRINEIKEDIKPFVEKISEENRRSIIKVNRREKFPEEEKDVQQKLLQHMPEVYAMMCEVYRRTVGFSYYDVQLRAGILLARGQMLVEQYTGEGKTMTFQLPLVLYSLAGRGAHLVTVNDYLTKIGAEYAGHFLSKLGLSVGVVTPEGAFKFIADEEIGKIKGEESVKERAEQVLKIDSMHGINLAQASKREAYGCDVTYGTNNEFGFDYLRDNMVWDLGRMSQRELYFCVIDEADSILIDEARTPLIISAVPSDSDTNKYSTFANAVKNLNEGEHFEVDYKARSVNLTEVGMLKVEEVLGVENLWDDFGMAYHLENALRARSLFLKDDQYILRAGNVYIVDEFTGRVLEGRRYSEGLHQAIEAKEGVEIKQESKTYATITFQNFFRLYKFLCGGSGTILTESEEFYKIYGLDSSEIPTNKPRIRIDHADRIYKSQEAKFRAVVEDIREMNEIGRPVLIGTTSVEKSELLSNMLDEAGIEHEVLNAKFHEQESRIVAEAGRKGSVTVATNMAGRGTDIVIGGGSRGDENYKEVESLGGLHVIGTERHDARRIDNQLRGRTGRQGERGSTRFYSSLDDQIMRVLGGDFLGKMLNMIKVPDDMPIEMGFISKQIEVAQKRVENVNFDSRKSVVEYDDVMNQHREVFYSRRRGLLVTSENALGKFLDGDKLLDLALSQNSNRREEFETKIKKKQEDLENIVENLIMEQIEKIVFGTLPEGVKVSEKDVEATYNKLVKIIPPDYILKDLKTTENKFAETILAKGNEIEGVQEHIVDVCHKAYNAKIKELGDDYYNLAKMISLETLDQKWVDHLEIMKDVRDSIRLQGYAQRDPLVEYKNSAYEMFESLINNVNNDITSKIFRITKTTRVNPRGVQNVVTNEAEVEEILSGDREFLPGDDLLEKATNVVSVIEKNQKRTMGTLRTNSGMKASATVKNEKKFGRNDKVTVKYSDGKIVKDVKFKKVENDVASGLATIV